MKKGTEKDELIGYVLRDVPREVMDKMRAAAAIHKKPAKTYIRELFEAHIKDLEGKGLTLSVPPTQQRNRSRE